MFPPDTSKKNSFYDSYCVESDELTLNDFISFVVSGKDTEEVRARRRAQFQKENVNADGTAGKAIYEYVKGLVLNDGVENSSPETPL